MVTKKSDFNIKDVERVLILKSWWAAFFILPVAKRAALFILNYTDTGPDAITFFSVICRLFTVFFFLRGGHGYLIAGAVLFQIAYMADCIDGPVARLRGLQSKRGRYFDHMSDLLVDIMVLMALAWGAGVFFTPVVFAMIALHFSEYYITFIANLAIEEKGDFSAKLPSFSDSGIARSVLRYRDFFFRNNFKSFFSFPDYEALIFFIFPVAGLPSLGIKAGCFFLVLVVLYKIFSSFITIQTGGRNFP